jgi:hypothetical protein
VAEEFVAAAGSPGGDSEDSALAWYGDTAYGTGELREAIGAAGHQAVIKPKPVQPAVPGGFTREDFTVDEQAGTVTCPAGLTRTIPPARHVVFGAACSGCPLRARCTTSRSGRVLSLHPLDRLLRAAREQWAADPGLREDYARQRPNVERVIAQVATFRGRRLKLRYRGVTRNHAWLKRHRRAEPAQPGQPRTDPPRRRLGAGHLTGRRQASQATARPAAGPPGRSGPHGQPDRRGRQATGQPGCGAGLKGPARRPPESGPIQQAPSGACQGERPGAAPGTSWRWPT